MKKFMDYVAEAAKVVEEVMPWDLEEELKVNSSMISICLI